MRETHLAPNVLREIEGQTISDWLTILYYENIKAKRAQQK